MKKLFTAILCAVMVFSMVISSDAMAVPPVIMPIFSPLYRKTAKITTGKVLNFYDLLSILRKVVYNIRKFLFTEVQIRRPL